MLDCQNSRCKPNLSSEWTGILNIGEMSSTSWGLSAPQQNRNNSGPCQTSEPWSGSASQQCWYCTNRSVFTPRLNNGLLRSFASVMSANSYWIDDRLSSQRVAVRTLPTLAPARDISRNIVGSRTEVRRRGGLIPSWVVFGIVVLATFALCVSVTMRSRAEAASAASQYQNMSLEVQKLREVNTNLELEVRRLNTDSRAIETAARTRLNMVRTNEIVMPAE